MGNGAIAASFPPTVAPIGYGAPEWAFLIPVGNWRASSTPGIPAYHWRFAAIAQRDDSTVSG